MAKTNIERFDEISASVLAHLYENFPIATEVHPTVAGLSVLKVLSYDPVNEESVTEGALDPETQFFDSTLEWLVASGFVSQANSRFSPALYTLTSYGLQSLKHVAQPAISSETLGDRLSAAARGGLKEATSTVLNQALTIGTGLMLGQLGFK